MEIYIEKFIFLSILSLCFISLASADQEMDITAVDEPFSLNQTGVNTTTVQVVRLNHSIPGGSAWGPITGGMFKHGSYYDFFYNKSKGDARKLNFLEGSDGYWYAEFKPNFTRGDMIKYALNGTVEHEDGDVVAESTQKITEDLNVGDLQLDLQNSIQDSYKAGEKINVEVSVKNASTDNYVTDSDGSVEVFFANKSGKANSGTALGNYDDQGNFFFNSQVPIPDKSNSTYIMHINSSNSTGQNPYGHLSKVVQTNPSLQGEISLTSREGCTDQDTAQDVQLKCEQSANVSISYNITASSANSVDLTTYAFNSSGKEKLGDKSLNQDRDDQDHFTGSYEIPDLNTSKYDQNSGHARIEFEFNASNNDVSNLDSTNVSIVHFNFEDRSDPKAFLGEDYTLKLFLSKPYSNEPYNLSRFKNLTLNVTNPSGTTVENFTKSDLSYKESNGLTRGTLTLESDMATGSYGIEGIAYNKYSKSNSLSSGFNVKDIDKTFNITEAEFNVSTLWSQNFTTSIENVVSENKTLTIDNELPEEIELQNSSIELEPDEEDVIQFQVNLTGMENVVGDLGLEDNETGYKKTVEISTDTATCLETSGKICSQSSSPIDVKISNKSETKDIEVTLLNVGPADEEIEVETSITGNISSYLEIEGNKNFNISDKKTVELNYSASQRGNYSGSVMFEVDGKKLEINTTLDANVTEEENNGDDESNDTGPVLSADPSKIDLGYLPEGGETDSETISLTNNGDEELSGIDSSSSTYTVTATGSDSVESNETFDLTLEFESVESESGYVTINAGDEDTRISVLANPVPDYSERAEEDLRTRLQDLQEQETTTTQDKDLTGVSTNIAEIKSAWDAGNYEEAQTLYNDADTTLQTVSNELESDEDESDNTNESGGIPIIPVAGGIFALILILFVILTSYVPEKGDPLYSLLGD
jgi:hypothetical protein